MMAKILIKCPAVVAIWYKKMDIVKQENKYATATTKHAHEKTL